MQTQWIWHPRCISSKHSPSQLLQFLLTSLLAHDFHMVNERKFVIVVILKHMNAIREAKVLIYGVYTAGAISYRHRDMGLKS